MQHTLKPWTLSDEDSPLVSGADGTYIAQVFSRTKCDNGTLRANYAADAQIIAACPDMLFALREALAFFDGEPVERYAVENVIRSAIAKATGAA